MIKLLVVGDLHERGVSVSRAYPLERLAENGYNVTTKMRSKYPNSYDVQWCDVLYFLRANTHQDLQFIRTAKLMGKKIWIDTDDDLLNVPIDHSGYFSFQDASLKESYIEIHKIADHITYSTKELADAYRKFNARYSIIPCAYADERVEALLEKKPTNKIFLWRGTSTHEKSILEYASSVAQIAKANPSWEFKFIGHKPWPILEKLQALGNSWRVEPFMDVEDMLNYIHQVRPAVHLITRTDNPFTRSRSAISYVEATFGGAVTIAPDWEEWRKPGIINYKSKDEFVKKANRAAKESQTKRVTQAAQYIKKSATWGAVNKQHFDVMERLMK